MDSSEFKHGNGPNTFTAAYPSSFRRIVCLANTASRGVEYALSYSVAAAGVLARHKFTDVVLKDAIPVRAGRNESAQRKSHSLARCIPALTIPSGL